ncbi:TPA: hypothetical protein QHK51_002388 [Klebsiella pneumoniae subsp. ozaenae]|nr:hypothetical protein [Klebsiella pneumoniae subsp. ozaenae]
MSDITELAQSLKAAAIDAKELAIIARYSKGRAAAEKFYALANPNNVIALVEALEKAQAINAAAEKLVRCKGRYHSEQNYRALAALFGVKTPDLPPLDSESRTVTVKLPQRLQPGADGWDDWYVHSDDEGEYLKFDDVLAMLTAAGIKVEAE